MPVLNFKGKPFLKSYHNTVQFHRLVEKPEKSLTDSPSLDDNLIIHGDNLKALKALLPTHAGKVKCIYIDPPYNTGNEGWAYNDNVNSPMIQKWLGQVVAKDDLSRHDKWCCMMYPRLVLLRELLRDNGVIFVSIDDNELQHLRMMMDEIFGDENWIGTIVWKNVTDNNPTNISVEHEYILCFAKNKEVLEPEWKASISEAKALLLQKQDELLATYDDLNELTKSYSKWFSENKRFLWPLQEYDEIDLHGIFTGSRSVHNPGREGYKYDIIHPRTNKPCKMPLMGYRYPKDTAKSLLADRRIIFGEDESKIIELKLYLKDYKSKLSSLFVLDGRRGVNELKKIFSEEQ